MTNCPNCAAPIKNLKCEFCGTEVINFSDITPGKLAYIKIHDNIFAIQTIACSMNYEVGALPEFEFNGEVMKVIKE